MKSRVLKNRRKKTKKLNWKFLSIICIIPIFVFASVFIFYTLTKNHTPKSIDVNLETPSLVQTQPQAPAVLERFASITAEQRATKIPILMYHDVPDIPKSNDGNVIPKIQFEEQLKYLKDNGYTTITAQEFIDAYSGKINLPKKSIFLTLDDGFQSIKTVVNPLLKQYDMRATSFIIGSYINRPQWHLTVEDIKEVAKDKLVDFESHTYDLHKDGKSKGLINETAVNDIVADNKKLEEVIGHKTNILCYPFGAFSKNAFDGLAAAQIPFGFAIKSGASTWVHLNEKHITTKGEIQNPLALPRIRMNANTPLSVFADLISEN